MSGSVTVAAIGHAPGRACRPGRRCPSAAGRAPPGPGRRTRTGGPTTAWSTVAAPCSGRRRKLVQSIRGRKPASARWARRMPAVSWCGSRLGQRIPPPAPPDARCAHWMCRKYSSSNASGSVMSWSLKVWIGPCSLSRNGRPSGSRPAPRAPAARRRPPAPPCRRGSRSSLPRRSGCWRSRAPGGGRSARSARASRPAPARTPRRSAGGPRRALPLQRAQPRPDVADEVVEAMGPVLALDRVHLVPQVPGEHDAVAAPAAGRELEPALDERPRPLAGQQPVPTGARAAVRPVVGVSRPS